jgi:DNA-binding transcriptional LysR family regulator
LFAHTLIGSDRDTAILDGFKAMGYPISAEVFALRCDDFIVQWHAVRAGLGVGFAAQYMLRTDPQVLRVLTGQLHIPPLPMWLAVHREIRTSQRIRAVYDFLAASLPEMI